MKSPDPYRAVRGTAPDLYRRAVALGHAVAEAPAEQRAAVAERGAMELIAAALQHGACTEGHTLPEAPQ